MASRSRTIVFAVLTVCAFGTAQTFGNTGEDGAPDARPYVNFIVVGATGSLAQKYLWQGLYELQQAINGSSQDTAHDDSASNTQMALALYGGARAEYSKGQKALKEILDNSVSYADSKSKQDFAKGIQYIQLKTCDHYAALCRDMLNVGTMNQLGSCEANGEGCGSPREDHYRHAPSADRKEAGRVFYLAVPPYSYTEVAQCIHRVCRPKKSTWLRLVLEKPFGTNADTVNSLVTSLRRDYVNDEIYLVDHYLGKPGVQQILTFRYLNRDWLEPLMNSHHVERIEVVIKEEESVEGRLNYYDTYGVFLDILQNHAMEMLSLAAMDLPDSLENLESIIRAKLDFLQSMLPIHPRNVVSGQYSDYLAHGRQQFERDDFASKTPTFGAMVLLVPTTRWRGMPFFLVSGKALDTKESYVKITFKNTTFSLLDDGQKTWCGHIVIYVSSKGSTAPWMSITKELVSNKKPIVTSWEETSLNTRQWIYTYSGLDRAYSKVVSAVYAGQRDIFVSMDQLTASWAIWDEYLKVSSGIQPKLYSKGSTTDLDIEWTPTGLKFRTEYHDYGSEEMPKEVGSEAREFTLCRSSNVSVIVKPLRHLVKNIVDDLLAEAIATEDDFHMAIPGGRTPVPIFHQLMTVGHFPWRRVHFWFTDERCVPHSNHKSNFFNANNLLFRHTQIPYLNIHPMPVDLASGLCDPQDDGTGLYADVLLWHLGDDRSLDVVVLGVGADGHVASLFPKKMDAAVADSGAICDSGIPDDDSESVMLTQASEGYDIEDRMSLTFDVISRAKKVFMVITGKDKHGVIEELRLDGAKLPSSQFPVKNVGAVKELRLYIDDDAYHG